MTISLFLSAYLVLAFYLFKRDKSLWRKILRYIQETTPASPAMLSIPLFMVFLLLPVIELHTLGNRLIKRFGSDKVNKSPLSDDHAHFIREHYPEIEYGLTGTSITLEQTDIAPFLLMLIPLFDSGFSEFEQNKIERVISRLTADEEEKMFFSVSHNGKRTPFVVEIEIDEDDNDAYLFTFYANEDLAKVIDKQIDDFCKEA